MKKGEICLIEFISFKGHEQKGFRPAIIMTDETVNLVLVIPFTSKTEALNYNYTKEISASKKNGLENNSIALIFQLRVVDKKKIKKKIGELEKDILSEIDLKIKEMLKLK